MWFYLSLLYLTSQLAVSAYHKASVLLDSFIAPLIKKKLDDICKKYPFDESNMIMPSDNIIDDIPVKKTHQIIIPSTKIEQWLKSREYLTQVYIISLFSLASLIIMKTFVLFNSLPELTFGSIVGFGFYELFKLKYGRLMELKEIYKSVPIFTILPFLLVMLRNFFDTYTIGLVLFNMKSIVLFLTSSFSVLFAQLLHLTNFVYPHKSKILVGWCLLGTIAMIL